jgi:hypothetical protein
MATNNITNNLLSNLTATGAVNLNATGSGVTTIGNSSGGVLTFAANTNSTWAMNNKSFTLTTGTGTINIGTDNTTKTITIGSATTTAFTINSSGLTIDSATTSTASTITKNGTGNLIFNFGGLAGIATVATNVIGIGDTTLATGIQFGNKASTTTGNIGNQGSSSAINIVTGTGTINIGTSIAKTMFFGGSTNTASFTFNVGTGGFLLPRVEVTTTSATLSIGIAYVANNSSQVVLTLPTTAAVGTIIQVCGSGSGGWKIAQLASQQINSTATSTTSGTGGSLSSGGQYDCVELVCGTANLAWSIKSSTGTLSFV